jgi:hypothetical protein
MQIPMLSRYGEYKEISNNFQQRPLISSIIARSEYGLMVQILAGLITYLLLAIYCHQKHNEKVSIQRVRELRIKVQNEARNFPACAVHADRENDLTANNAKDQWEYLYAKT